MKKFEYLDFNLTFSNELIDLFLKLALSAPKTGSMATAVLRPVSQSSNIHMSYSSTPHGAQGNITRLQTQNTGSHTTPVGITRLQSSGQVASIPRAYLPVRSTTPPITVTRATSPANIHSAQDPHRYLKFSDCFMIM